MAEFEKPKHGTICWRELATSDSDKAAAFYTGLFGWRVAQSKSAPSEYLEIEVGGRLVGGITGIEDEFAPEDPRSHWVTYIAVDDADRTVEKIRENGGSITAEPFHVPGVGRIAFAADPAGATFAIIQLA